MRVQAYSTSDKLTDVARRHVPCFVSIASAALLLCSVGASAAPFNKANTATLADRPLAHPVGCVALGGVMICDGNNEGDGYYDDGDEGYGGHKGNRDRRRPNLDRYINRKKRERARKQGYEEGVKAGKQAEKFRRDVLPRIKARAKKRREDAETYDYACRIAGAC